METKTENAAGPSAPAPGSAPVPLVALRRYGFDLTYHQRKMMREERKRGAVPTATDESNGVLMSRHFVARDGKTYTDRTWVFPGGSIYSYSEPAAMQNNELRNAAGESRPLDTSRDNS